LRATFGSYSSNTPKMSGRTTQSNRRNSQTGFSLLEVTTVLAIVGVLTAVAVPHLRSFTIYTYLRGESDSLRLFLEKASGYALASRQQVTVRLFETNLRATSDSGELLGTHTIKNGVTLRPDSAPERKLLFRPTISASPATVELLRNGRSCSVVISLRGRIRVSC
jgi:type II secretion system protein H